METPEKKYRANRPFLKHLLGKVLLNVYGKKTSNFSLSNHPIGSSNLIIENTNNPTTEWLFSILIFRITLFFQTHKNRFFLKSTRMCVWLLHGTRLQAT